MKRFFLLVGVPTVAVAVGVALWLQGGRYEETENAYVKAHMIAVSADVSGRVVDVRVRDNEPVAAGALLFRIDPVPFELAVARAEAEMAVVRTTLEGLRAEHRVALADAAEAQERIGFLARQLERQQKLKERGMGLEASYDEARHNLEAARRRLESAHEKAARVLAALGGDLKRPPEAHPSFLAARAARDAGRDELARVRVVAPAAGIVSNMRLQVGERVERGVPVFSLIESRPMWIEANFKETQLGKIRPGQRAEIEIDAIPGRKLKAHVTGIGSGTGSEFSILPAQNATGNWVKVTQRVPVRLVFDETPDRPIVSGWSAHVTIHVKD